MLQIGPVTLSTPVALAPMAGITDRPYRELVASFGAGLVVSEMVASVDIVNARPGTRERAELALGVAGSAVQLAGRETSPMAEAARMVEANGARIIDINMGCPAKKVTNGYSGSALMRDLDHALRLIDAVVSSVDVPVTLKTRLGWDDNLLNAPELSRRAQSAGVQMITIHGRTRCQFYKGRADWAAIAAIKDAVDVPVLANGDITDALTAKRALERSGADGVMIGRGAQGRPWMLAQIAHDLFGTPAPVVPEAAAYADMVCSHYEAMLGFYGTHLGVRCARKHLGWYMDHAGTPADQRRAILTAIEPADVFALLPAALHTEPVTWRPRIVA
ncbi:MAG: tRNA dihydrouridine synthase DusB [Pseudomonadota bacterium]